MQVSDLVTLMDRIAPPELAEPWDNTGLLLGDPDDDLRGPILLTIDLTMPVLAEAIDRACGAIVAYHPLIFKPIRALTPDTPKGRVLLGALQAGIAVYSPHTALDAAPGGVADWLLDRVAFDDDDSIAHADRESLAAHQAVDSRASHKLVVFVPVPHLDALRAAIASAGAGRIGHYSSCSFSTPGRGTFLGSDQSNPAVGQRGRLESVDEVRMEMVVGTRDLSRVIDTLRAVHPYEEPAFDLYPLAAKPNASLGPGRCMTLNATIDAGTLAQRVRQRLGVPAAQVAPAGDGRVTRVAVCPGSGATLVDAALHAGCDGFVTGEMSHHEVLAANEAGLTVILAGHTETERGYLPTLAANLKELAPAIETIVSTADTSPLRVIT